jgi:hypothetical protein
VPPFIHGFGEQGKLFSQNSPEKPGEHAHLKPNRSLLLTTLVRFWHVPPFRHMKVLFKQRSGSARKLKFEVTEKINSTKLVVEFFGIEGNRRKDLGKIFFFFLINEKIMGNRNKN